MKSIYQDKIFASFWNNRVGDEGEDYKRFILDPLMLNYLDSLENKVILELGCGNGYMGKYFLKQNPTKVLLSDISEENLNFAKLKYNNPTIEFLQFDAAKKFPLDPNSVDIIYSNMMLNEISNIDNTIKEAFRVLKDSGKFIFSVLHPAFLLYHFVQEHMGGSKKFVGLEGYFSNKMCKYLMGSISTTKSAIQQKTDIDYEVDQKIRTLEEYFDTLVNNHFIVKKIFEPELSKELLEHNPGFSKYKDVPIGLVFACEKIN